MADLSLKKRTFRGFVSYGGATLIVRVVGMVGAVFLARLVEPAAFGLVALGYLVLSIISLIAPLGLAGALIQHRGDLERASFQVFVMGLLSAAIAFLSVNLAKHLIASLLEAPDLASIIPPLSLMILVEALDRVPDARMQRDLKFERLGTIRVVSELTYYCVAIGFASLGYGLWSLIYGVLVKAAVGSVLSWTLVGSWGWIRWRKWDRPLMQGLFRYGRQSIGSNVAYQFVLNFDNFVVGRQLGVQALGYYSKAFDFTKKSVDHVNKVVATVMFPSYSSIQDDLPRLSKAYLMGLKLLSTITVPASMGLFMLADRIVPVLFGERWIPMVPILQVLTFMSLVKPISSTTAAVFNAVGRPAYNMHAGILVGAVMVVAILLLLPFGTVGIAASVVVSHIVGLGFNMYQINKVLPGTAIRMFSSVRPALLATMGMVGVLSLFKWYIGVGGIPLGPVPSLIFLFALGVGSYIVFMFFVGRSILKAAVELLPSRRQAATQ